MPHAACRMPSRLYLAAIISGSLQPTIGHHKSHLARCADFQSRESLLAQSLAQKGRCRIEPRFRPTPRVSRLWRTPVQPATQPAKLPADSPLRLPSLALAKLISLARMVNLNRPLRSFFVYFPEPYLDYPKIPTPLLPQSGKSPGRVVEGDFSVLEPLVAEDWLNTGVRLRDSLEAFFLELESTGVINSVFGFMSTISPISDSLSGLSGDADGRFANCQPVELQAKGDDED